MFDSGSVKSALEKIAAKMAEERQHLVELDQRNGDGDLGISMADGYYAASNAGLLTRPRLLLWERSRPCA